MRRQTSEWTVRMLADLRGRINTDAEYQRGEVWSEPQQQLLIDSILRGFDLPKIFLRKLPDGSEYLFDVVDGVQRLTSIWRFLSDEFALPKSYVYDDLGPVGGRRWSELPQDAKDRLQFAKVTVTELETDSDDDIRELFQRLQKGEPLNAAERRNAMAGPVRNFVANTLAIHALWPETGLASRRFAWHEMSAIVLALVRAAGPIGLKGADLLSLYEDDTFDPDGPLAKRTLELMDRLYTVAAIQRGALRTRWGVVDLSVALMRINAENLRPSARAVMAFFQAFEIERRAGAAEISDLRSTVIGLAADDKITEDELPLPSIKPDMLTYLNAFTREGASQANVEARAEVMTSRLRRYLQTD
ncbi:MAG: DUF262 domain-containing protein [Acidimicrobiales bacterium]